MKEDAQVHLSRPAVSSARQFLREATHAEHVRLNLHPLLSGITKPGYSLDRYQLVLIAYYHLYKAIEGGVERALGALHLPFLYAPRRKLPWIEEDLAQFGLDPESAAFQPKSPVGPVSYPEAGDLVGVLYAIEGSSLGGKVISRHLEDHLGLCAAQGARFFHGYGEKIMPFWQQVEELIDTVLSDEHVRGQAARSAKNTFELIEAVLDEYLVCHPV